jgi:hypothetical protein
LHHLCCAAGIANLPHEVKRNFALMQDLDQQTQGTVLSTSPQAHIWLTPTPAAASPGTMDKLEQSSRAYLKRKTKDASVADDRALQKIRDDFKRAMEMGDEKIELAAQTYELVRSAFDYVCRVVGRVRWC